MTSGEHHVLHALGHLLAESRTLVGDSGEPGLRTSHHRVLGHVPPDGVTVSELAERVGMTKQGIGQFVAQLSGSGHVRVERHAEDGRVRVVRRTAQGEASVRRLAELLEELEARWAERVGAERYREFRRTLDELAFS